MNENYKLKRRLKDMRNYIKRPESVKLSERQWDGSPIVVSFIQVLPSGFPVIKSISNGKVITLFLDTPIQSDVVQLMKKNINRIYIAKDENGIYYDFVENLQNNENENEPPF
jgi:hypothetical protein